MTKKKHKYIKIKKIKKPKAHTHPIKLPEIGYCLISVKNNNRTIRFDTAYHNRMKQYRDNRSKRYTNDAFGD